jgi:hypothetical protein
MKVLDVPEVEDVVAAVVCDVDEGIEDVVLVRDNSAIPMMVCASPSGTEKVPVPLSQSQLPEDSQQKFPFPQFCKEPLFEEPDPPDWRKD